MLVAGKMLRSASTHPTGSGQSSSSASSGTLSHSSGPLLTTTSKPAGPSTCTVRRGAREAVGEAEATPCAMTVGHAAATATDAKPSVAAASPLLGKQTPSGREPAPVTHSRAVRVMSNATPTGTPSTGLEALSLASGMCRPYMTTSDGSSTMIATSAADKSRSRR